MAFADITDPWAAREKGIADYQKEISRQARYKHEAPERAWEDMVEGHQKAVSGTLTADEEKQFKQDRRNWNRQYKNTPVGIMASGVDLGADPFGAQDLYHDMSSQLYYDQPKLYDRMYPFNPTRLISGLAENIGPGGWVNKMIPKRDRIIPENVLAMQERFPGINKLVPEGGLSELVPEHIRQQALFDINETVEEGEGIFGGTGQSLLEEPDLEKYFPPISDRSLAEWYVTIKPEMNLTVERTEELIRDLEPTARQFLIEQYEESQ
jgi:hypothetical protein